MTTIGVHVHAEPHRLRDTLAALRAHTPPHHLILLPDGPDAATRRALAGLAHLPQLATDVAQGPAACLNRLARATTSDTIVLLESGGIVAPGWLDHLTAALAADPAHGLASPSTNRAWNQLAAFPHASAEATARTAAEAARRFGTQWKSLAPLWDVGDFCLAVTRTALDAAGPADEGYGLGPCWELDFAARAAAAGFRPVWAMAAYVFRHPFTPRRLQQEARLFETSRRRYQDAVCGRRRSGERTTYARHCRGADCGHFGVTLHSASKPPEPVAPGPQAGKPTERHPLVSCIMPTNGRAGFVAQAIAYFQRQTYPNLELIIVDASPTPLACPADPRIHHHHVAARCSIGAMRNIACDLARGAIIIHWDDDDWYGPARVETQVEPILSGQADITGLTSTTFFDLDRWRFWRCAEPLHARMFRLNVHGGTLAYRRSLFTPACRYPDASLAEDAAFLERATGAGGRLARLSADGQFVYLRHATNAWRFACGTFLDPAGWQETPEPAALAADRAFYAAHSRAAPTPAKQAPPSPAGRSGPLASCIMPTANRRAFIPGAITRFLAQDYPTAELVILDDGDDPVADLIPAHPSIRYLRTSRHRTLGSKRNAACDAARGDVILHWDDDDWYAPDRIRRQIDALEGAEVELNGIDRAYFLDPRAPAAWEYVYPPGGAPWVCGATLCYRKRYWQAHPFADITVGEDTRFAAAARPGELAVIPDNTFFVALVHAGNTSPKRTRDTRWRPADVTSLRALTGPDWPQ